MKTYANGENHREKERERERGGGGGGGRDSVADRLENREKSEGVRDRGSEKKN